MISYVFFVSICLHIFSYPFTFKLSVFMFYVCHIKKQISFLKVWIYRTHLFTIDVSLYKSLVITISLTLVLCFPMHFFLFALLKNTSFSWFACCPTVVPTLTFALGNHSFFHFVNVSLLLVSFSFSSSYYLFLILCSLLVLLFFFLPSCRFHFIFKPLEIIIQYDSLIPKWSCSVMSNSWRPHGL